MTRCILHPHYPTVEVQFIASVRQVRWSKGHIGADILGDVEFWNSNFHRSDHAVCENAGTSQGS